MPDEATPNRINKSIGLGGMAVYSEDITQLTPSLHPGRSSQSDWACLRCVCESAGNRLVATVYSIVGDLLAAVKRQVTNAR